MKDARPTLIGWRWWVGGKNPETFLYLKILILSRKFSPPLHCRNSDKFTLKNGRRYLAWASNDTTHFPNKSETKSETSAKHSTLIIFKKLIFIKSLWNFPEIRKDGVRAYNRKKFPGEGGERKPRSRLKRGGSLSPRNAILREHCVE
ncbi:hypothetical protein A0128_07030 [Leptospira tipperaryensis]|uniref:Uncharacterized protein n=1 Tax=Leptospira tipperaryensis TaxID=2564040 RepID=A0A1D7UVJ7_9LEPT|nr:hypothetical protein A0128_07030 [Leptospira tipperaryensis]